MDKVILHEQRGPARVFSVAFFSQLQFMAVCLPHEHLASVAQMQLSARPQQVVGLVMVDILHFDVCRGGRC